MAHAVLLRLLPDRNLARSPIFLPERAPRQVLFSWKLCRNDFALRPALIDTTRRLLKPFQPGSKLDLVGPRAAGLAENIEIGERNCVRIKQRVRFVCVVAPPRTTNSAIDHEVC